MDWNLLAQLAVVISVLVLVWQTRALKLQVARTEMQTVYDRYLEITKIEVVEPKLHKMFLYGRDYRRFSHLTPDQLHERALSLLIFDQFAMIFNMSRRPTLVRLAARVSRMIRVIGNRRWVRGYIDRHRTVWEINEEYVRLVLTNPHLIESWREWGLGETWEGSEFHRFVETVIAEWEATGAAAPSKPTTPPVQPSPARRSGGRVGGGEG